MKRIVLFASGSGTNVENIIRYFQDSTSIKVTQVLTNNKNAKVIERCKRLKINCFVFNRKDFYHSDKVLNIVKKQGDYIILAGFLWKVPENFIAFFSDRIINIHPALLPKFGGKGMYGMHIHKAVIMNKEKETGITIHFVNEQYDEGAIIFQKKVSLLHNDTLKDVANKIHQLEMRFFPQVIERVILNKVDDK